MKKAILTIGLFSLVMILTSFTTPENTTTIKVENNAKIELAGSGSAKNIKVDKVELAGSGSAGNIKVDNLAGSGSAGNIKVDTKN